MTKKQVEEKPKPKWKKRLLTLIFIAINVGIIAWTAIAEFSKKGDAAEWETIELKWWLLIPAVVAFLIATVVDVYRYVVMLRETCGIDDWKLARRTVMLGRYYDNLTPAAVGGQPFQILHMKKNKVPGGYSVIIPIVGMISLQISFLIVAVLTFIFGGWTVENPAVVIAGWIGLIFYAIFPLAVFMGTFFPKATTSIIIWGVKVLHKIKIVKDEDAAVKKTEDAIAEYVRCVKKMLKNKKLFLKVILLGVVYHIMFGVLPYFILLAFGGKIGFFSCYVITQAITSAVYLIPTPGSSGAAEGSFYLVFSSLTSGYIFWAMLTWRLFTYYSYILIGLITYGRMYLEKKRPKRES